MAYIQGRYGVWMVGDSFWFMVLCGVKDSVVRALPAGLCWCGAIHGVESLRLAGWSCGGAAGSP
ncbi:MAG: hypothetical protein RI897_4651 [Verrucomicrobiota bacterium]|jgi:hypothetical protein